MKNKKVLYSVLLIIVVGLAAVGGTYAYFTATRTTSANQFVAGTLDLDVASNGNKLEPFVITNMGADGNIGGTKTWTITNTGSLPGRLYVRLQNLQNVSSGCINDQKKAADPDCAVSGHEGNLGKVVNLVMALNGADVASSTLATAQMASIGTQWSALPQIVIQPGAQTTVTAHWATGENSYGNEIQGDSVVFDMNFRLVQLMADGTQPAN
jgi:predicted ribosomally synthesized peptide with SipW-like signal peptide